MGIKNRFESTLETTRNRYEKNKKRRVKTRKLLEDGEILEANPTDLVERRLSRLKFDSRSSRAIISEGLAFTPATPGTATTYDSFALERILGTNDLMGISFLQQGASVARAVARIHIHSPDGSLEGYGTGFMVSPRLLLTNNHVLENAALATNSRAEFNFEVDHSGGVKTSTFIDLDAEGFFLTDPDLDYSLIAINPESAPQISTWLPLSDEQGKAMIGEWVNIIQHPNGEPKQIALRENQIIDELEQFLHYHTDTAPGSSGSPVFNDQWEVVALHHSGVPEYDSQGNILTTDGRIWQWWMGEHRIAWIANEGARISRIVEHIKAQELDQSAQHLRAQMFESVPAEKLSTTPDHSLPNSTAAQQLIRVSSDNPSLNFDGSATWEIPLSVTVALNSQIAGSTNKQTTPAQPSALTATEEDPELHQALAALAASETRDYYNQIDDKRDAELYYCGLNTNVSASTLFKKLSELVRSTHKRTYRYKPSRHVYPWVDLHPDLKIRSIYSGDSFEPEELIREDFRIEAERVTALRELMSRESNISQERLELELDLLETSKPFNCEHVVPQSWYDKKEPMRGDLHHLFTCESRCNSFRGNLPYFDFVDFEEAVRDKCGKQLDRNKFEPSNGKGAVARATLYFLLRYPGHIGNASREMQMDRLPFLLNWHQEFPVDEYERHRNMAVFEKQGNRNPLIDHPKWAEKIDFTKGME